MNCEKENPTHCTCYLQVYTKCVLEAKKRYVGFKMESIDETPSFDAKGIETVRRDGCPAAQKMLENVLK